MLFVSRRSVQRLTGFRIRPCEMLPGLAASVDSPKRPLHVVVPKPYQRRPEFTLTESYIHCPSDIPYVHSTLARILNYQADTIGDKVGFVVPFQNVRKTYAEFNKDASDLANGLVTLGLLPGDRIGMWSPNCYEWLVTMFAASKAGLILVNVNPVYRPAELEFCMNKVEMKAIVAAEGIGPLRYYEHLQQIAPEIQSCAPGMLNAKRVPHLKHVIMTTDKPESFHGTYSFSGVVGMKKKENAGEVEKRTADLQPDDPFNIQFTSGTTGTPKGATLSSFGLINDAFFCGHRLGAGLKTHSLLCQLPLFHVFAFCANVVLSTLYGLKLVVPSVRFDPEATMKAVQDEKCQTIMGVPTMFRDIVNHPNRNKYDLSSLKCGVMGGAPCPPELIAAIRNQIGIKEFCVGYGSTEQSVATFFGFLDDPDEIACSTSGFPLGNVEAKVVDLNGRIVPIGQTGELLTRHYGTMLGYWNDPEKTKETILPDRWLRSGDLATLNEKGYLAIVGRAKDMVIRGGENIYPVEIENVFLEHQHVMDAIVHGVPCERMGEQVCAWIRLRNHQELIKDRSALEKILREFCQLKLAKYKTPKHFIFYEDVTGIPMTASGKVKKFELAKIAVERLASEAGAKARVRGTA